MYSVSQKIQMLASRKDLQWGRKFFHTANGLFGLWVWGFSGFETRHILIVLALCLLGAVLTEIFRRLFPAYNDWICRRLKIIMRERERAKISSATWYMISTLCVGLFFPRAVGMFVLVYVAVGDTAAGVIGTLFGRHQLGYHVSLEGFLAMFGVSAVGTALLMPHAFPQYTFSFLGMLVFSVLAGLAAALSESLLKHFDDNLTIPLLSAPAVWGLMKLFGVG